MVINPLFNAINERTVNKFYLEEGFEQKFSLKQRLYYDFVRKVISKSLRKKLQNKVLQGINHKENFIWDELTELIISQNDFNNTADRIFSGYNNAVVLTHDVEEQEGYNFIPKVIELENKYGFTSSWNIVPYKYKIDEGVLSFIKSSGGEIGIHGYNHDGRLYYSEKEFNRRADLINRALEKYDTKGFRSPMVHRNLSWLQRINIKYEMSCFDYDPYQPFPGGTGSIWPFIAGKFVELPYTLPQDHTLFFVLKEETNRIWENKIKWLSKNRGLILLITHPDYLQIGNNLERYEKLLIFLQGLSNYRKYLPSEIASEIFNNFSLNEE